MSKILIFNKNILDFDCDCVVNAANSQLQHGGGVCDDIFTGAGVKELTNACNKIGHCKTGEAVITPSFNLSQFKYIIHAVGPRYSNEHVYECAMNLYNAYRNSLKVMVDNGCNSIVFPLISSGIYGYPAKEAWEIALKACDDFITENKILSLTINIVVLDEKKYEIGVLMLKDILSKRNNDPTLKLYEAVGVLHEMGYERIRLMTYFSPSGCSLRTVISTKSLFDRTGFVCDDTKEDKCFYYTSGSGFEYFENKKSYEDISAREIAIELLSRNEYLKNDGYGKDTEYVKWFKNVLQYARNDDFPYAFGDYDYDIYKLNAILTTDESIIKFPNPGEVNKTTTKYTQVKLDFYNSYFSKNPIEGSIVIDECSAELFINYIVRGTDMSAGEVSVKLYRSSFDNSENAYIKKAFDSFEYILKNDLESLVIGDDMEGFSISFLNGDELICTKNFIGNLKQNGLGKQNHFIKKLFNSLRYVEIIS